MAELLAKRKEEHKAQLEALRAEPIPAPKPQQHPSQQAESKHHTLLGPELSDAERQFVQQVLAEGKGTKVSLKAALNRRRHSSSADEKAAARDNIARCTDCVPLRAL